MRTMIAKGRLSLLALGAAMLPACVSDPKTADLPATKPSAPARPDTAAPAPADASRGVFLCNMTISNAPAAAAGGRIASADARVRIEGAVLLIAPVRDGCLSSGFGRRGDKTHSGVDYFTRTGDAIAAGDGVIREKAVRADFGYMILIEHGPRVFTRYAHLASFAPELGEGVSVKSGATLGPIGATGAAGAVHLHYEILTGAYVRGVGSFGLSANDPFALDRE